MALTRRSRAFGARLADRVTTAAEILEAGRRPLYITVASAALVALSAVIRFLLMVWTLQPAQYGLLNLFTTINSILPAVLILGSSLQLQRLVRQSGVSCIPQGLRRGLTAIVWTAGPSFVVLVLLLRPYINSWPELAACGLLTIAISGSTGVCSFSSQIILGAGYRAASAIMMLGANTVLTLSLVVPLVTHHATVPAILTWWALSLVMIAALSYVACRVFAARGSIDERSPSASATADDPEFSYREGVASVPSLIGPWLLTFVVRYFVGLNMGPEALSSFAIAATVSDTALLIAVSLVTYSSNKILDGTVNPHRVFGWSAAALTLLAGIGIVLVPEVLVLLSRTQYQFDYVVALLLTGSALSRLLVLSWRNRLVAARRMRFESMSYIVCTVLIALGFTVVRTTEILVYPIVLASAYAAVAFVQQCAIRTGLPARHAEPPERPDVTGESPMSSAPTVQSTACAVHQGKGPA